MLSLDEEVRVHRCLSQTTVKLKGMPLNQSGLNQCSFSASFHYLQSWWKWLWDSNHGIADQDRQSIMQVICALVYMTSEEDLEQRYKSLTDPNITNSYCNQYPQLRKHLEMFWKRKSEWALSHRIAAIIRGNNTNNYAEAGIRVLKELIFGRVKAYNLVQMFQFVTKTMDAYYCS